MSNEVSYLIITVFFRRKDSNISFTVVPKAAGNFITFTHGRVKFFISMSFKKMSHDLLVNAVGKNKLSLQNKFVHDKIVLRDNRFYLLGNWLVHLESLKKLAISQNYHQNKK